MKKKISWQDTCPSCVKYDHHDHTPNCKHCRKHGVTERTLCDLNRADQENDPEDFQCDAYQPKQPIQ